MIAGSTLLTLLVTIVVAGLIFWLLWYFLDVCGPPEPFNKVARIVVALVAVIFLINVLMGMAGTPLIRF